MQTDCCRSSRTLCAPKLMTPLSRPGTRCRFYRQHGSMTSVCQSVIFRCADGHACVSVIDRHAVAGKAIAGSGALSRDECGNYGLLI